MQEVRAGQRLWRLLQSEIAGSANRDGRRGVRLRLKNLNRNLTLNHDRNFTTDRITTKSTILIKIEDSEHKLEGELSKWRSQFVTSNADRMGLRHAPMAFAGRHVR